MKIIEAMRGIKSLVEKQTGLLDKIKKHCADTDNVQPIYETTEKQQSKMNEWMQSHKDTVKEIERLRLGIQNTNMQTLVKIDLGGVTVEKPIAAWIHRRRDLSAMEMSAWRSLHDEHLQGGTIQTPEGTLKAVNVRIYFDKDKRDNKIEELRGEPHQIDAALEIINATTEVQFAF